jgi:3D (Asp-Asp-Asp) domain-containing protein
LNLKNSLTAWAGGFALMAAVASMLAAPTTTYAAPLTTAQLVAEHPAMGQDLSVGDFSHWVCTLQADLMILGYPGAGPMNCYFSPSTEAAVEAFQRDNGLTVTGSTNAVTWQDILAGFHLVPSYQAVGAQSVNQPQEGSGAGSSSGSPSGSSSGPGSAAGSGIPATIDGYPVQGVIHMIATAYGPSLRDNYPYGPVDAFGQPLQFGMVAVDPSVIPLKTHLYVTGYTDSVLPAGGFLAEALDTGGAIQGDRIDIFMNQNAQTVSNFGFEPVTVYVLG